MSAEHHRRRWLPWVGGAIGLVAIAWVLRSLDTDRFQVTLRSADFRLLALVPLTVVAEQLVRAWKWRQLLLPLRSVATLPLFGAIMAGYLLAILVPFGFGTVARSWLVARRENLRLSGVLASVALDRLTDGIVFAALVPVALLMTVFSDPSGIRAGLAWAGAGSIALFALVLLALAAYRHDLLRVDSRIIRLVERLPTRVSEPIRQAATAFAEGAAWPRKPLRGVAIITAALVIKLLAAMHFLWAGLAFGILLAPAQYIFLLVFLGFLVILGHFARVAGSFLLGAIFALSLIGVPTEPALAMALVVEAANVLSVAIVGALTLWRQSIALSDLRPSATIKAPSPRDPSPNYIVCHKRDRGV